MEKQNNHLRNACHEAALFFKKLGDPKNNDIQAKLDFVVGSYDFDKNPVGLYEIGANALKILKAIKEKNPKKVSKALITNLEENLKQ
jgi:hypothetical protein